MKSKNLNMKLATGMVAITALVTNTNPVAAAGLDTSQFKSWVSSYLDPLERVLLWVIPVVLGIYLLVKAIQWFSREAEGGQQPSYWSTVSKAVIVGVIAESIDIILTMFSITN